ncbi:hypothetical protein BKA63DRAFT_400468 [Paraphoma chrysanthemicola]|nr:hypothetical protein BKA63DRAFT_400468 [Paraphoma chrysanthemicola]
MGVVLDNTKVVGDSIPGQSNPHIYARDDPDDRDPNTVWGRAVCKGERLVAAMQMDHEKLKKTSIVYPVDSHWDGELRVEMEAWGYKDVDEDPEDLDFDCQFDLWGFEAALTSLGIEPKSAGEGGPNECYRVTHMNGPAVIRGPGNRMPEPVDQRYRVGESELRATGGDFKMGLNAPSGVIYFLDVKSPATEARRLWSRAPALNELPAIRYLSDITWALWNRHMNKQHGNRANVRYIFAMNVANDDTETIIENVFARYKLEDGTKGPDTALKLWPGTKFKTTTVWGAALLGSVNGAAAAHFLIQHKSQIGNKWISEVTIWENENEMMAGSQLLFKVEDVPPNAEHGSAAAEGEGDLAVNIEMAHQANITTPRFFKRYLDGTIINEHIYGAKL